MSYSDSNSTRRIAEMIAACAWEPCSHSIALRLEADSPPDFVVQDHGTIWTFYPRSKVGQAWWAENVEDGPCLGRNHCVEPHYAQDILDGLQRDGFTAVSGRSQ